MTTKLITLTTAAAFSAVAASAEEVRVYNWSDYIDESLLTKFEEETGIKLIYDVFDSNELLETKMLAGGSGYDVVVPTGSFLARQIQAGAFQKLDQSKLTNVDNMWDAIEERTSIYDPGNEYSVNYMWGTTGIAYNEKMVQDRLGADAPTNSWSLVLDPKYASKLEDCGIAILDAPTDVLPNVIAYLGKNGTSTDRKDFEAAGEVLNSVRPHVRYIHSSQSINDMANGDICAAIMWSGDAFQAAYRAEEAENGHVINYVIPDEGTNMWFDVFALPKDAANLDNAYKFVDYMMRPDVAANNVNYVWYASGNEAAKANIDPEILEHPGIYPTDAAAQKLFVIPVYSAKLDRTINRVWSRFSTGN